MPGSSSQSRERLEPPGAPSSPRPGLPAQASRGGGAGARAGAAGGALASRPSPAPGSLADWLARHTERIAREWSEELRSRGFGQGEAADPVVDDFIAELAGFLPLLLGPRGKHLQPLWDRACELFGVIAAKRGLAAGEVIEELQIVRELVIRLLYEDPPRGGAPQLREVLRLNRIADRGITHASVGHTDAMFFQLLEAPGAPVGVAPEEIAREVDVQLASIRSEVAEVLEPAPRRPSDGGGAGTNGGPKGG